MLVDRIDDFREAVRYALQKKPFRIDAFVVLPEHLYAVWTLPPGEHDYSKRWGLVKGHFCSRLVKSGMQLRKNARGEYDVWQPRFWEHTIRDDKDFAHHVDYIHYNPVKHGLVTRIIDWPYSSFHRYVNAGVYPPDWGGEGQDWDQEYGE